MSLKYCYRTCAGTGIGYFMTLLLACGSGEFRGQDASDARSASAVRGSQGNGLDSLESTSSERNIDSKTIAPDTKDAGKVTIGDPTKSEKKAIASCNKSWGDKAIKNFSQVRKIYAAVSVNGNGVTLQDTAQTSEPMLTIVYAGVNVGGDSTWRLENRNGWYCIMTSVNVGTNLTVRLARNAKLADSRISVNVGSNVASDFGAIGVHVGSDVKVQLID